MTIPFEIPAKFAAQLDLGQIERFGTILKEVGTGRIVGHLQETGALQAVLTQSGAFANPVSALVNAASGLGANLQLYRLDNKVDALRSMMGGIQSMQLANLALAGLGIGVSALGFALVKSRLDAISGKLDELASEIRSGFQEQRARALREAEANLRGELDNAAEGWHARDGGRETWSHVVKALSSIENVYVGEIRHAVAEGSSVDNLTYLVDRYRVAVATKMECYVLLDEFAQGQAYAETATRRTTDIFQHLNPVALMAGFARTAPADARPLQLLSTSRAICLGLRELQDLHATAPLLLRRIGSLGIRGRDYVERLKHESQEPLLVLGPEGQPA